MNVGGHCGRRTRGSKQALRFDYTAGLPTWWVKIGGSGTEALLRLLEGNNRMCAFKQNALCRKRGESYVTFLAKCCTNHTSLNFVNDFLMHIPCRTEYLGSDDLRQIKDKALQLYREIGRDKHCRYFILFM